MLRAPRRLDQLRCKVRLTGEGLCCGVAALQVLFVAALRLLLPLVIRDLPQCRESDGEVHLVGPRHARQCACAATEAQRQLCDLADLALLLRDFFDRHVVDARRRCLVQASAASRVQLPVSVQLPRLSPIPCRHAPFDGTKVPTDEAMVWRRPDEGPQRVRQQMKRAPQRIAVQKVHYFWRTFPQGVEQHVAAYMRVFIDLAGARHVVDLTELGAEASRLPSAMVQEHTLNRAVAGGGSQHRRHLLHRCLAALDTQLQSAAYIVGELEVQRVVDLVFVHGGDVNALRVNPLLHARRQRDRCHGAVGQFAEFSVDFFLGAVGQLQRRVGGPCVDPQPPVVDPFIQPIDLHFHVRERHQPVVGFFLRQHVNVAICVKAFQ